jgi:hypothetical protein
LRAARRRDDCGRLKEGRGLKPFERHALGDDAERKALGPFSSSRMKTGQQTG